MLKSILFMLLFGLFLQGNKTPALQNRKYFTFADTIFEVGEVKIQHGIYWDYDKTTIRPESDLALDSIKSFLLSYSNLTLEIGVFIESIGNKEYVLHLSKIRAESIGEYLIAHGISSGRISTKGYLQNRPAEMDDPKERIRLRRIELKITSINYTPKLFKK